MARPQFLPKCGSQPLYPRFTEEELRRFEESIARPLPEDYRDFLLQWNGVRFGRDQLIVYPIQHLDNHSTNVPSWDRWLPDSRRSIDDSVETVSCLYGLQRNDRDSLWVTSNTKELNIWTPERFFAIGDVNDQMEIGQILLSLDSPDRGAVFCFGFPVDPAVPGKNCQNMDFMWWVAPNFQEFWSCLREMPKDEYFDWR
jgi:SMI1 / KNR4 family (SUKH-1)